MEVIWKNTVSVHLDLVEGTRVTKLANKNPRGVPIEDARTTNSAVHDMVPRAFEIHSQSAGHVWLQTTQTGVRPLAPRVELQNSGRGKGSDPLPKRGQPPTSAKTRSARGAR